MQNFFCKQNKLLLHALELVFCSDWIDYVTSSCWQKICLCIGCCGSYFSFQPIEIKTSNCFSSTFYFRLFPVLRMLRFCIWYRDSNVFVQIIYYNCGKSAHRISLLVFFIFKINKSTWKCVKFHRFIPSITVKMSY